MGRSGTVDYLELRWHRSVVRIDSAIRSTLGQPNGPCLLGPVFRTLGQSYPQVFEQYAVMLWTTI